MKSRTANVVLSVLLILCFSVSIDAQQVQGPRNNSQVYSGVVYGPIDQSDTLWRIASRYKQDSQFTVYQTMMAIYELNQQAFENGNFNTMVNGATLQLPSDRYIARVDAQRARAKAERDDQAFGRRNSVRDPVADSQANPAANLKPEIPLVNQEDLSKSQSQLQSQLNALRRQQQQQFDQLKNQVAASINSVEVLLAENNKLNERLLQIDDNNRALTETMETVLQEQINEQDEKLEQLIDLFKQAEERRIEEESKSVLEILSSPTALILMTTGFTVLVLVGLFVFLLRKSPAPVAPAADATKKGSADIVDDDLVIGEADELDSDSDDLMAALENDLQEDDILSDDLEDDEAIQSLSDDDLASALDLESDDDDLGASLDDLDDDMLVPDSPEDSVTEDLSGVIDETDAHEFDADAIDLDGEDDSDEIDLTDPEAQDKTDIEDEFDAISLDDEPEASEDGTPPGIDLDENGDIDESTLDQIEQQIEDKDQSINNLADELLEELDAVPEDDDNVDSLLDEELSQDQALSEKESDVASETDTSSDEELTDDISDLSNDLLAELEEDSQASSQLDDLLESSELELTNDDDEVLDLSGDLDNKTEETLEEEIENLLDVGDDDTSDVDEAIDLSTEGAIDLDAEAEPEDDQLNSLADELLQELEAEDSEADELDSLLDELSDEDTSFESDDSTQTESTEQSERAGVDKEQAFDNVDADDLLDDIPSFTSSLSQDDTDEITPEPEPEAISEPELEPETDLVSQPEPELEPELEAEVVPEPDIESTADPELNEDTADETEQTSEETDDDTDVLSALPDLDDWLDEDDPVAENPQKAQIDTQDSSDLSDKDADGDLDNDFDLSALELDDNEFDSPGTTSLENELIDGLDDADFDDMLNDLANDEEFLAGNDSDTEQSLGPQTPPDSPTKLDETRADEKDTLEKPDALEQAGIDLESLMTEEDKSEIAESDDFLDVDDLLAQSDAMPSLTDDELDLNLEDSLDKLVSPNDDTENLSNNQDFDSDQASNLDLAQVYIDMEDFEAAQELLDEVLQKGNSEQQSEAKSLKDTFPT